MKKFEKGKHRIGDQRIIDGSYIEPFYEGKGWTIYLKENNIELHLTPKQAKILKELLKELKKEQEKK